MDTFLTWDVLLTFGGLVGAVYMVVEFTKEIKFINKIPTKYWSFFIAVFLIIITHIVSNSFNLKDIVLYLLNSIVISLSSNGLNDFNKDKSNGFLADDEITKIKNNSDSNIEDDIEIFEKEYQKKNKNNIRKG